MFVDKTRPQPFVLCVEEMMGCSVSPADLHTSHSLPNSGMALSAVEGRGEGCVYYGETADVGCKAASSPASDHSYTHIPN